MGPSLGPKGDHFDIITLGPCPGERTGPHGQEPRSHHVAISILDDYTALPCAPQCGGPHRVLQPIGGVSRFPPQWHQMSSVRCHASSGRRADASDDEDDDEVQGEPQGHDGLAFQITRRRALGPAGRRRRN